MEPKTNVEVPLLEFKIVLKYLKILTKHNNNNINGADSET